MREETSYDAIVIGSGMTGGWAAKELTEKELRTLVLEAGPPIVPEEDYVEHVPPWEMKFRGMRDRRRLEKDQQIQRLCYACDEWSAKLCQRIFNDAGRQGSFRLLRDRDMVA